MTKTILLVEDHPTFREHFVAYCRIWFQDRVSVVLAASLEEAQTLFMANPSEFDLIVMDACVPGDVPNSMPLVRTMRETFTGPIIACSSSDEYAQELIAAGCDSACSKDYPKAEPVLRRYLGL